MKIETLPLTTIPALDGESRQVLMEKFLDSCGAALKDCDDLLTSSQVLPLLLHLKSTLTFMQEAGKILCMECEGLKNKRAINDDSCSS